MFYSAIGGNNMYAATHVAFNSLNENIWLAHSILYFIWTPSLNTNFGFVIFSFRFWFTYYLCVVLDNSIVIKKKRGNVKTWNYFETRKRKSEFILTNKAQRRRESKPIDIRQSGEKIATVHCKRKEKKVAESKLCGRPTGADVALSKTKYKFFMLQPRPSLPPVYQH